MTSLVSRAPRIFLFLGLALMLALLGSPTWAAETDAIEALVKGSYFKAGVLDGLVVATSKFIGGFSEKMQGAGVAIFSILAALELSFSAIEAVVESGTDLEKLFYALWKKILKLSIFWLMLSYEGFSTPALYKGSGEGADAMLSMDGQTTTFLPWLAFSLMSLGAEAAFSNPQIVTPSRLIDSGMSVVDNAFRTTLQVVTLLQPRHTDGSPWGVLSEVAETFGGSFKMWGQYLLYSGGVYASNLIAAALIALGMFVLALQLFATLVEMTIATAVGGLFLAGGASRWTQEYAMKAINYAVSVGVKGIVVFAIAGILQAASVDLASYQSNTLAQAVQISGASGSAATGGAEVGTQPAVPFLLIGIAIFGVVVAFGDSYNAAAQAALLASGVLGLVVATAAIVLLGLAMKVQGIAGSVLSGGTSATFGALMSGAAGALQTTLGGANRAITGALTGAGAAARPVASLLPGMGTGAGAGLSGSGGGAPQTPSAPAVAAASMAATAATSSPSMGGPSPSSGSTSGGSPGPGPSPDGGGPTGGSAGAGSSPSSGPSAGGAAPAGSAGTGGRGAGGGSADPAPGASLIPAAGANTGGSFGDLAAGAAGASNAAVATRSTPPAPRGATGVLASSVRALEAVAQTAEKLDGAQLIGGGATFGSKV